MNWCNSSYDEELLEPFLRLTDSSCMNSFLHPIVDCAICHGLKFWTPRLMRPYTPLALKDAKSKTTERKPERVSEQQIEHN